MSLFKRVFVGVYSSVDRLVGEIENHDALIRAAIGEQRRKIAAARLQLRRVRDNERRLGEKLAQLAVEERQWSLRAVKEAPRDEERALACLARRHKSREQAVRLAAMQQQYRQSAEKMQADIARCDLELESMGQKHELLRARQSSAEAMQLVAEVGAASFEQVQASFDRWELRIAQGESVAEPGGQRDELESEYLGEEMQQQLRHELAELLESQKMDGAGQ